MRILSATNNTYPPQRAGGAESATHDLCMALQHRGVAVAALAKLSPKGYLGLYNRLRRNLFPATQFPSDTLMGYAVYRGWEPPRAVHEVIERFRPTLTVVHAGKPMTLVDAFLSAKMPTVLYLHDVSFKKFGRPFYPHPLLLCIANSHFTASRFMEVYGVKPYVIPPFVDARQYKTATSRRKAVFVGLIPEKGLELAFQLAEARPDIPFEFVESWPLGSAAFDSIKLRAQGARNITVRRRVPNMRDIYGIAKILLAPSKIEEGWGRVCTEAQVSGVPVLASRTGGLPESVGPGGLLVDVDAPLSEWLAALSTLWDDDASYRRYSDAALLHSKRPAIQFASLVDDFLDVINRHLSCGGRNGEKA